MDAATRWLIEQLHCAPYQYVLTVTGGGTQAAAHLLNVPGGSRTLLEIMVPGKTITRVPGYWRANCLLPPISTVIQRNGVRLANT